MTRGRWLLVVVLLGINLAFVDYRVIHTNGDNLLVTVIARSVFTDHPLMIRGKVSYQDNRADDPLLHHQFYKPPLYAIVMAMVYAVLGENIYYQIAVSSLLTALTPLVMAALSRDIWGSPTTGLVAGALYAISPQAVYVSATGMEEPLEVLCSALALWGVVRFQMTGGRRWLLMAGALAGLAFLASFRGAVMVAVVAGVAMVPGSWRWRKSLAAAATVVAAFLVVAGPWLLRNYVVFGDPFYAIDIQWFWLNRWSFFDTSPDVRSLGQAVSAYGVVGVVARFARSALTAVVIFSSLLSFLVLLLVYRLLRPWNMPFGERVLLIFIASYLGFLSLSAWHAHARYFPPALAVAILIAVEHARQLAGGDWLLRPRSWSTLSGQSPQRAFVALVLAASVVAFVYADGREYLERSKQGFSGLMAEVGVWLRANTRADDIVMMTYPVTAMFYAERTVLQLPRTRPTSFAEEVLDRYGATYFIDFEWRNPPPRGFEPIQTLQWGGERTTIYRRGGASGTYGASDSPRE